MGLIAWSFADHCKKAIIWTTTFIADLLNQFSAEARKLLEAEGRTPCRTSVAKLLANPERFGETKPGEVILVASYLLDMHLLCQKWDEFVQPDSRRAARMGGKLTSRFPYTLPVSKRIPHPVTQWHGNRFLSAHHTRLIIGGSPMVGFT